MKIEPKYAKLADAIVAGVAPTEDGELTFVAGPKTIDGQPSVDGVAQVAGVNGAGAAQG